jgi:hypothetical protein
MIKINLLKEKKAKKTLPQLTFASLKEVNISDLIKIDKAQYYLSVLLWIGVLGMGVWYWKISKELTQIKLQIYQIASGKKHIRGHGRAYFRKKEENRV